MRNLYLLPRIFSSFTLFLSCFFLYGQTSQPVFNKEVYSESDFRDVASFLYRKGDEENNLDDLNCRYSFELHDKDGNRHKIFLYKDNSIGWSLNSCYLLIEIYYLDSIQNTMIFFCAYKVIKDGIVDLDYRAGEVDEKTFCRREAIKDSFSKILSKANPSKVKKM